MKKPDDIAEIDQQNAQLKEAYLELLKKVLYSVLATDDVKNNEELFWLERAGIKTNNNK